MLTAFAVGAIIGLVAGAIYLTRPGFPCAPGQYAEETHGVVRCLMVDAP